MAVTPPIGDPRAPVAHRLEPAVQHRAVGPQAVQLGSPVGVGGGGERAGHRAGDGEERRPAVGRVRTRRGSPSRHPAGRTARWCPTGCRPTTSSEASADRAGGAELEPRRPRAVGRGLPLVPDGPVRPPPRSASSRPSALRPMAGLDRPGAAGVEPARPRIGRVGAVALAGGEIAEARGLLPGQRRAGVGGDRLGGLDGHVVAGVLLEPPPLLGAAHPDHVERGSSPATARTSRPSTRCSPGPWPGRRSSTAGCRPRSRRCGPRRRRCGWWSGRG